MIDRYFKIVYHYYHFKMNKLVFKLFCLKGLFGLLLAAIVFLSACSITGNVAQIPEETAKNPEVYFCPREDCSKVLESSIASANNSVHCAFYDLNLKNVINELSMKSKNADVKLVIEKDNYEEQIKGNAVKLDSNPSLMHDKFCVIDDYIVVTGSFNPTENDNYKNNNNVVVFYSKSLAANYEDEFNEMWEGVYSKGDKVKNPIIYINSMKIENYFCPEDKCADKIINLIENAKYSVYFMTFSFTNEEIGDALIKKDELQIKGIFDSSQASGKYSQLERLQGFKLDVKKDSNKYKMHHKVFIIDNETVATGSFNPTLSGDTRNDENLLIIHDKEIAKEFLEEFDGLWSS